MNCVQSHDDQETEQHEKQPIENVADCLSSIRAHFGEFEIGGEHRASPRAEEAYWHVPPLRVLHRYTYDHIHVRTKDPERCMAG